LFRHVFATLHDILDDIAIHYAEAENEQKKQYAEQLSMLKSISDTFIEEWLQLEEKIADFHQNHQDTLPLPTQTQQDGQPFFPPPLSAQLHAEIGAEIGAISDEELLTDAASDSCDEATATGSWNPATSKAAEEAKPVMSEDEAIAVSKGQGYFKLFMFPQAAAHFQEAVSIAPENNQSRLFLAMTYMHLQEWHDAERHFQLLVELTEHPKWQALGYNALGCIQAVRMNLEQAERYFLKAHETDPAFTDPLSNLKSCQEHEGQLSLYFGSGQL